MMESSPEYPSSSEEMGMEIDLDAGSSESSPRREQDDSTNSQERSEIGEDGRYSPTRPTGDEESSDSCRESESRFDTSGDQHSRGANAPGDVSLTRDMSGDSHADPVFKHSLVGRGDDQDSRTHAGPGDGKVGSTGCDGESLHGTNSSSPQGLGLSQESIGSFQMSDTFLDNLCPQDSSGNEEEGKEEACVHHKEKVKKKQGRQSEDAEEHREHSSAVASLSQASTEHNQKQSWNVLQVASEMDSKGKEEDLCVSERVFLNKNEMESYGSRSERGGHRAKIAKNNWREDDSERKTSSASDDEGGGGCSEDSLGIVEQQPDKEQKGLYDEQHSGSRIARNSGGLQSEDETDNARNTTKEHSGTGGRRLGVTRILERSIEEREVGDSRVVQAIKPEPKYESDEDVQIIEPPTETETIDMLIVEDDDDDDISQMPKMPISELPRIPKKKRTVEQDGADLRIVIREEGRHRDDMDRRRKEERRRDSRSERDSHRDKDLYRESHREKDSYRERESYKGKESYKDKDTHRDKESHRDKDSSRDRDSYRDKETYRDKDAYRDKDTYKDSYRDRDSYKDKDSYRDRDSHRDKDSYKDSYRDRESQGRSESDRRSDSGRRSESDRSRRRHYRSRSRSREKRSRSRDRRRSRRSRSRSHSRDRSHHRNRRSRGRERSADRERQSHKKKRRDKSRERRSRRSPSESPSESPHSTERESWNKENVEEEEEESDVDIVEITRRKHHSRRHSDHKSEEAPVPIKRQAVTWSPSDTHAKDPSETPSPIASPVCDPAPNVQEEESDGEEEDKGNLAIVDMAKDEASPTAGESAASSAEEEACSSPVERTEEEPLEIPVPEKTEEQAPQPAQIVKSGEVLLPRPVLLEPSLPKPGSGEGLLPTPVRGGKHEESVYDPAHPTDEELEREALLASGEGHGPPHPSIDMMGGLPGQFLRDGGILQSPSQSVPLPAVTFGPHRHLLVNPVIVGRPPFPRFSAQMPAPPLPPRFQWQVGGPGVIPLQNQFGQCLPPAPPPPPPRGYGGQLNGGFETLPMEGPPPTIGQFSAPVHTTLSEIAPMPAPPIPPQALHLLPRPPSQLHPLSHQHLLPPQIEAAHQEEEMRPKRFDLPLPELVTGKSASGLKDLEISSGEEESHMARNKPLPVFKVPLPPGPAGKVDNKPSLPAVPMVDVAADDPEDSTEVVDMDMSPLEDECELELPTPPDLDTEPELDHTEVNNTKPLAAIDLKALSSVIKKLTSQAGDDLPTSAVDLTNKEKYLKKLHLQERVVDEVKQAIRPFYSHKKISKDEYKEILRKCVPKVCHSKSGDINPQKIQQLVEAYVTKFKKMRKGKKDRPSKDKVKANGERIKSQR